MKVTVIGAGLAGCECALQIAKNGINVKLIESKPHIKSQAHSYDGFAELVCSNSLKSTDMQSASGLLKAELEILGCELIKIAFRHSVPAGSALAVERYGFSDEVTSVIKANPLITVEHRLAESFDKNEYVVLASGPLSSGALMKNLEDEIGDGLHFYDAAAPIITAESIDLTKTFSSSRYGKGNDDYVNCPLDKSEYYNFVENLVSASRAKIHEFDKREFFEGCMPIEVMASRGVDTLRFGPLRPVGFTDSNGKRPFAVVQLRAENRERTLYNIVGFQTNLKFGEQKRVFSLIPALNNCEIVRYGVMHRNTYINSPKVLNKDFSLKSSPKTFIAGQLTGVEGYVESIATGLLAGENVSRKILGKAPLILPDQTVLGALCSYVTTLNDNFQPMNANFGILPMIQGVKKAERKSAYVTRSLDALREYFDKQR